MPQSSTLQVVANIAKSKALDLGVTAQAPVAKTYLQTLTDGTGAGKADLLFFDTRTIAVSGTDDLDLNGVLLDAFGATLSMLKVKAVIVTAASGNTNNVVVGGAASNQFATWTGTATDKVVLRPGATFALIAGSADATCYAVTAATGDILRIANSGAGSTVDYDIVIIGSSV